LALVWVNDAGGLTFTFRAGAQRCFIKWAPAGCGLDLAGEAARMTWAGQFHPVPRPLGQGHDDEGAWLITAALAGDRASDKRWQADPATAVTAIGEGLRALHETLPVAACPFTWSAEWNYGPGWDNLLLDAYGVRPDADRTRYYRLLWDLSS
jgi:kanamycin kinase